MHNGQELTDVVGAFFQRAHVKKLASIGHPYALIFHVAWIAGAGCIYCHTLVDYCRFGQARRSFWRTISLFNKLPIITLEGSLRFRTFFKTLVFRSRHTVHLTFAFIPRSVNAWLVAFPDYIEFLLCHSDF